MVAAGLPSYCFTTYDWDLGGGNHKYFVCLTAQGVQDISTISNVGCDAPPQYSTSTRRIAYFFSCYFGGSFGTYQPNAGVCVGYSNIANWGGDPPNAATDLSLIFGNMAGTINDGDLRVFFDAYDPGNLSGTIAAGGDCLQTLVLCPALKKSGTGGPGEGGLCVIDNTVYFNFDCAMDTTLDPKLDIWPDREVNASWTSATRHVVVVSGVDDGIYVTMDASVYIPLQDKGCINASGFKADLTRVASNGDQVVTMVHP